MRYVNYVSIKLSEGRGKGSSFSKKEEGRRKAAETQCVGKGRKVEGAERVMGTAPGSPGEHAENGKVTEKLQAALRQ